MKTNKARTPINPTPPPSHFTPRQSWIREKGFGHRLLAGAVAAVSLASLAVLGVSASAQAAGTYQTTASGINIRTGPGTGYKGTVGSGVSFVLNCQYQGGPSVGGNSTWDNVQFSNGISGVISDFYTNTPSWNTYAPGTGSCATTSTPQMQAAAAWAIAEKNSPDPTWSDHFNHAWSGWCEEFAEEAEGFPHQFASAIADYNWENANGRIHTDPTPPPGALVFYGGGGGDGHVAVSIGGGQEIGTYGYVGQRLPVKQYPVIGYLTNPYLGWAFPWGS